MNQFGGNQRSLPGIDPRRKAALEHRSLAPRNRMHRKITDPRTLLRERELLQHGKSMWQHLRPGKITEPKTEIDWIGHIDLELCRVVHSCVSTILNCLRAVQTEAAPDQTARDPHLFQPQILP